MWARKKVNKLPVPKLMLELMEQGKWQHPGDAVIRQVVPFFQAEVDFLQAWEVMARESGGQLEDTEEDFFYERRSSKDARANALPWRDLDKSFLFAVNRERGDDIALALDFRSSVEDPQVIGNNWYTGARGCVWELVSPLFSAFCERVGLV